MKIGHIKTPHSLPNCQKWCKTAQKTMLIAAIIVGCVDLTQITPPPPHLENTHKKYP